VILDYGNQTMRCAQVIRLFNVLDGHELHATAYVRILGRLTRSKATGLIQCQDTTDFDFVSLDSFVRSVHVYTPKESAPTRFLITDTVDPDIYLRLAAIQ
jgi:hypothetical protein